jgi:hypothetical protein
MKNASLLFLITAWMLFHSNNTIAAHQAPLDRQGQFALPQATQLNIHSSARSGLVYSRNDAQSEVTQEARADFYRQGYKAAEQKTSSFIPYWFYALKIITLIVVLLWDDSDKSKSMRKPTNTDSHCS